jgi:hypothetical protein
MQVDPQLTSPDWQVSWHVPFTQTCPPPQTWPAFSPKQSPVAPQCVFSVVGLMHVPPQLMRPAWHESWQTPALQTCPVAHAVPALGP